MCLTMPPSSSNGQKPQQSACVESPQLKSPFTNVCNGSVVAGQGGKRTEGSDELRRSGCDITGVCNSRSGGRKSKSSEPLGGGWIMASEPGQPTLFMSYAHADQARAKTLATALEQAGYTVWWDALIEGGTRYAETIDQALQTVDVVLVLWSKKSIQSDWVRDEAAQGRDRHRLVPLRSTGAGHRLGFGSFKWSICPAGAARPDGPQFEAVRRAVASAMGHARIARGAAARLAAPRARDRWRRGRGRRPPAAWSPGELG